MIGLIESAREIWELFLRVVETAPREAWAAIAGTLAAWGVTQRAKFWIPEKISSANRHRIVQAMAFAIGFEVAWLIAPGRGGLILGVLVGLWSPALYWIFVRVIGKKWPVVRERLSQDVRP